MKTQTTLPLLKKKKKFSKFADFTICCSAVSTVSQLQQTLGSIQELLIQQQQRIQELSQELNSAKVYEFPLHQQISISYSKRPHTIKK